MSKLGTCKWAFQVQELWREPGGLDYSHPHTPRAKPDHIIMPENYYTCQWLDACGPLPPPLKRRHGGLHINPTDCDHCPRYEAVSISALNRAASNDGE